MKGVSPAVQLGLPLTSRYPRQVNNQTMRAGLRKRASGALAISLRSLGFLAGGMMILGNFANPAMAAEFIKPGSGVDLLNRWKPPDIRQVVRDGRLIHREAGALAEPWRVSKELSQACSRGLFKQQRDRKFIAIFDRRVYGAAVGDHASLVHKTGLAEKQVIYLFDGQGTTDCRVYHRNKA